MVTSGGRPLAAILVAAVWRQVCGVTPEIPSLCIRLLKDLRTLL